MKKVTLDLRTMTGKPDEQLVMMERLQEDMGNHGHDFFELVYITGGTAKHTRDGKSSVVRRGDYFIMDCGSVHRYEESRGLTLINCLFLPQVIDETLAGVRTLDALLQGCFVRYYRAAVSQSWKDAIFRDEDGRIEKLLAGMLEEYSQKLPGCSEIYRCRLTEILIVTMRGLVPVQMKTSESSVVSQLLSFVEGNYAQPAPLQKFCESRHYSLSYISRRFKKETGMNVRDYVQRVRIEKSCELLEGSDLGIADIARAVGYEDEKSFREAYRGLIRMSPREYRKLRGRGGTEP